MKRYGATNEDIKQFQMDELHRDLSEVEERKERAAKIGVCNAFLAKLIGRGTIKNKVRYLLEDFFFDEGWAGRTNPNNGKNGYNTQHTYNDDTIKHFIEDFTRWIEDDWEKSFEKAMQEAKE